ncbi:acyl-coenzyme a binding protein [Nannochloropsis oceanica]
MSGELQQRFEEAAKRIAAWKPAAKDPSDEEKLLIYALFKQSTVGDCNTPKPGLLDFTGRRKHGAWEKQKGKDKIAAMEAYIAEVERQISTYGTKA